MVGVPIINKEYISRAYSASEIYSDLSVQPPRGFIDFFYIFQEYIMINADRDVNIAMHYFDNVRKKFWMDNEFQEETEVSRLSGRSSVSRLTEKIGDH